MPRALGRLLLVISGLGFPLSQIVIRRSGRRGAFLVEGVTTALLIRDAYLVASGTPARLAPGPRALLYAELAVAACASAVGLRALTDQGISEITSRTPDEVELLRRAVLGTLFGLHTWRFAIYLGLDRGLGKRRSRSRAAIRP
jgi:hypothetical protein